MYGIEVILLNSTMQQAEEKAIAALKSEGFGVLTEIDVQATLKAKIDIDRAPYKILGACNPVLANEIINLEPDIGLFLPCNVLLQQLENGTIKVAIIDPESMFKLIDNPAIADKVDDVKQRFERIMAQIKDSA